MRMKPQPRKRSSSAARMDPSDRSERNSWRFLRIMPTCILQDNMQGIPCEFASKFNSKPSTLTTPNGRTWMVKISKRENKLMLRTGWRRFIRDNSIKDGYMIAFKYKGYSDFSVRLFDPSGSEVHCNSPLVTNNHTGKQKNEPCDDKYINLEEGEEGDDQQDEWQSRGLGMNVTHDNEERSSSGVEPFMLSLENPYFVAKIRRSRRSDLLIPSEVINTFGLKFGDSIYLEDPKRRKWEAQVINWKDGRTWLTQGWKRLCKYNMVSDKDTCICEFMPSKGSTFHDIKVHIFRAQNEANIAD